jgi:hypothetical protein
MGWGTYLRTDIYFNRETFNSKYQVEEELAETKKSICDIKAAILQLATMTEPEKFFKPEPGEEYPEFYIDSVNKRMSYLIEELEKMTVEEYTLSLLLDEWNRAHDPSTGYAYDTPESEKEGKSYVFGDFIETNSDNDKREHIEETLNPFASESGIETDKSVEDLK